MTPREVYELMKSSKSEEEWNKNCDIVKSRCNGYPDFWWNEIIASGLAKKTMEKFGSSPEIKIKSF